MKSAFLLCALLLGGPMERGDAQDLPVKGDAPDLQKEAGQLIDGLPNLDRMAPVPEAERDDSLPVSVEAEKARLAAAKKKQLRWEKLARQGVLSQAEAEQCQLEVAAALARYEHACVNQAQQQCDSARRQQPPSVAMQQAAAAGLESSRILSAEAERQLSQTRLRLAQVHLERMRRLYSEKLTTRNELERAQSQVARLQAQSTPAPAAPAPAVP